MMVPGFRFQVSVILAVGAVSMPAHAGEILKWNGAEKDPHPCLYATRADVARVKASLLQSRLDALAKRGHFLPDLASLVEATLFTDNPAAQKQVVSYAKQELDNFYKALDNTFNANKGPHTYWNTFGRAVGAADAALSLKTLSAADRDEILKKIAMISYKINRPDYWGFNPWRVSYNYNMYTIATAYRLAFAALIPSHPMSKEWFNEALTEHKWQIDNWIDPHGGNAETPHYATVSLDQWVASFVIAKNAGAPKDGHLYDEKLKLAIMNLGNISTPPDAKNKNLRRLPSVGHTYKNESSSLFGLMANLWKKKDPAFAGEMLWMYEQHGKPKTPGILSYYPAFDGYESFFSDHSGITARKPNWTSQYYPEVGVQLRNVIGSDRETTLYMIAGRHHNHYFNDSGSITIWGKGAELCHEDDYQTRRPPVSGPYQVGMYNESHSMPGNPSTYNVERVMDLREFSSAADFDYVSGERQGWTRQIGFVKDKDPLAPNYFVLADTFDETAAPTVWRLYVAGNCRAIKNGITVTATDKPDVEMDVIFLPAGAYRPQVVGEHIRVEVTKPGTLTAVLYPRLKSEKTPAVTMLADGKGVQVKSAAGTDVVYLSPEAVSGKLGKKAFEGKAGLAKTRGGKTVVVTPGKCDTIPGWEGGDPQMRELRWEGPQFPKFPDYEEGVVPNQGDALIMGADAPAVAEGFTLPIHVTEPRQQTSVQVSADDRGLNVMFTCSDKDVCGVIKDQDSVKLWKDDSVYIWLDTNHDHKDKSKFIMLQVSASGAWHDTKDGNPAWNCAGMKADVKRSGKGWTARIQVPYKGLGVGKPRAGAVWGVNFSRMDQPGKEDQKNMQMSSWAKIPNGSDVATPDRWGHLLFTDGGDDAAARVGMDKVHSAIKARAFSAGVLLGGL